MTSTRQNSLFGLVGAVGFHGALLAVLFLVEPDPVPVESLRPPVRVRVVQRKPPVPAPKKEVAPAVVSPKKEEPAPKKIVEKKPKPKPKRQKPVPRKVEVAKVTPPEPVLNPEPAPEKKPDQAVPQEQPAKPARKARKFTVAMDATVPGGGVAVPVSNSGGGWAYGSPDGDPDGARIPGGQSKGERTGDPDGPVAKGPLRVDQVTSLPEFLSGPSADEMRAAYPDTARRDGLEADVKLKILVSSKGRVVRVRLVRSAGKEFDAVATKIVERFLFKPADKSGQSVAVWIPWTYKFRLEG